MQSATLVRLNRAMARLADGDRRAATEVFEQLSPLLERFARRAIGSGADVDDVVQASLEKIFARVSDYDPKRSALTWAMAITSWECRTVLTSRRRSLRREEAGSDEMASPGPNPEEEMMRTHMLEALREVVQSLPATDREALLLAYREDAEGAQSPTLRKRKERALDRLRSGWRKLYGS